MFITPMVAVAVSVSVKEVMAVAMTVSVRRVDL